MKKILLASICFAFALTNINAGTIVEDALIANTNYKVSGTFGWYDFPPRGDNSPYDWAFKTTSGIVYQLRGIKPTSSNIFGWKRVNISAPRFSWYMFKLRGDVDGDGSTMFDWVLASTNRQHKIAYKLTGISRNGTFTYSSPLNIDYLVSGTTIKTGAKNTLDGSINFKARGANIYGGGSCKAVFDAVFNIRAKSDVVFGTAKVNGKNLSGTYIISGHHNRVSGEIKGSMKLRNHTISYQGLLKSGGIRGTWKIRGTQCFGQFYRPNSYVPY